MDQKQYQRWLDAELEGRDDDADAAFGTVFRGAVPRPQTPLAFTARTMAAVTEAAARDLRRARTRRRVLLPAASVAALVIAYLCSGLMMSAFSAVVVKSLDLLIASVVYVATAMRSDGGAWNVAGSLGKATAAVLTNSSVTTTILALQGMAFAALVGLRRLLRE